MSVVALQDARSAKASGFVYFLRCADLVKIGFSREPDVRARNLGTMSPLGLEMVGLHPGTLQDEAMLHEMFASRRLHGEWFSWCSDIAEVAENGLPVLPNVLQSPDKTRREKILVAPIVGAVARKKFPYKVAAELSVRTGSTVRACERWLSGREEMGARPLAALLLSDMGPDILAALHSSKIDFVR